MIKYSNNFFFVLRWYVWEFLNRRTNTSIVTNVEGFIRGSGSSFFFLSSFRTGDLARKIIQITRIDELLGRSERSEFQFRSSNSVYQLYLFPRMDSTHHSFWTATNQNTISSHFYTFRRKVTNYLFSLDQFRHRYYSLLHFLHHEKYYIIIV